MRFHHCTRSVTHYRGCEEKRPINGTWSDGSFHPESPQCRAHHDARNLIAFSAREYGIEHGLPIPSTAAERLSHSLALEMGWTEKQWAAATKGLIAPQQSADLLWASYEKFRSKFPAPKSELNPRETPLGVHRERKSKPGDRRPPYHVIQAMAAQAKLSTRGCPILHLRKGDVVQKGKQIRLVDWEPDRIIPGARGGKYVPGNVRIISNIANSFKLDSKMTNKQIRDRFVESGYKVIHPTDRDLSVLRKYRVIA